MKLVDMVCPNCGAKIQADADMESAKCEHCGSTFILDDEAVHLKYDNAYEAGYQFHIVIPPSFYFLPVRSYILLLQYLQAVPRLLYQISPTTWL